MSLERYRRPRMIILRPSNTAYDAARAMVDNHVGALLVSEDQRLVGIVTDRDITCEVTAAGLDPAMTLLGDVMSDVLVTADIQADLGTVVGLMSKNACRRVPLTEDGRAVGMVTLDDLLLEGAIDAGTAAEIIRAQLETPARFKPAGSVHPQAAARAELAVRGARAMARRNARAAASYGRLLKNVELRTGITDKVRAELALKVVLGSVCRRVTPDEARHFIAQLPSVLQDELSRHLDGPDRRVTRATLENELCAILNVEPALAGPIAEGVAAAIAQGISAGEIEELRGQLPGEMKTLFPSWGLPLRA